MNDPAFIQFIGDKNVRTNDQALDYINASRAHYRTLGFGLYRVAMKEGSRSSIGICGLVKRDILDIPDLGFAYLPEYRSKGLAYEAAQAMMEHARNNLKISELAGVTAQENLASQGLLKKLGFHQEGFVDMSTDSNGNPVTRKKSLLFKIRLLPDA